MGGLDTNSRENERITLGLLQAVEAGRIRTQRGLAADLGIALGLVNIYLKRCVTKGLVKVSQAPARRYAYYLTPQGFAEKSRLTGEFLAWSLTFFRQAKQSCTQVLTEARDLGWQRIVLAGSGDLADIARICAADLGIEVVAIVQPGAEPAASAGVKLVAAFEPLAGTYDGIVVTGLTGAGGLLEAAVNAVGRKRVLLPSVVSAQAVGTFDTKIDEVGA